MDNIFTIEDYQKKIKEIGFIEYPTVILGDLDQYLKDFLKAEELDLELRIYITRLLICRCLGINSGVYLPADVDWWIKEFQRIHVGNIADFTRSEAIIEAIKQIQSDDNFGKCIIGTAFMYTVMEFYTKYFLGFNPLADMFEKDKTKHEQYQKINFSSAILKLKKRNTEISKHLCAIDKFFKEKAEEFAYEPEPFKPSYISYRLSYFRNMVLHGQNQFVHSEGTFLVLLYILYTYCHMKHKTPEFDQ